MILRTDVLRRILSGEVTLVFRRWIKKPSAKGSTLRTQLGVIAIDAATVVDPDEVTEDDAKNAGAASRAALFADLAEDGHLIRMEVRYVGADPRVALRNASLDAAGESELEERLARIDARAGDPWTANVLALIAAHPSTLAARLAKKAGMETALFKRRVRALKELGLTESLEIGYRLSPRGEEFLEKRGARK
jgi:hypothetical protein